MNIVVLAGGISTERDVSLISGKNIYAALKEKGQNVILIDVFMGYEGDINGIFSKDTDWAANIEDIKSENPDIRQIMASRSGDSKSYFGPNVIEICGNADIVFMALHGEDGENGKVQAAFDLMGIKYTGTDYVSAALSMDKSISKDMFARYDIPTPIGIKLENENDMAESIQFPKVVKAANGGSSVGVYITNNIEEYKKAVKEAFSYDNTVIVEEYVKGREFSVGVIEGRAIPIIEIIPKTGFYDYKNKYQPGNTEEICPAELPKEKEEEMKNTAEKVFEALRLKTYARVDFLMKDTDNSIYCLEANTLPGMTPMSLIPQEAVAEGINYPDLCMKIIDISMKKYE
ncbi:MAG: D-alanine--D-alanine ligase [Lachnospiraceae bacterium]|nr:D-alanine--D-alanine ligase [Lachnospiraceae bacterium]